MMLKFRILFFLLFVSFVCKAQQDSISLSKHIDFLIYLNDNGQLDDLNYQGDKLLLNKYYNNDQKDSLNFILGMINYRASKHSQSLHYLKEVTDSSIFYYKSKFYSGICQTEFHEYDSAFATIANLPTGDVELLSQLKTYELAAFSLLKRDYLGYDSLALKFNSDDSLLHSEQIILNDNQQKLRNLKRRSPLVAGTLSAIIPGLGLAYSGNNGQALAAFIRVAALGALTIEDYIKLGPENPQFIIFGSLFSFFYIGNIWGSALSVKIRYDEKIKEIDHNVMVGLRIPIDHFFR